jgi:hypothetical protein
VSIGTPSDVDATLYIFINMKYVKKLWGYGKTFAKHLWDSHKKSIVKAIYNKAFTKGKKYVSPSLMPVYE